MEGASDHASSQSSSFLVRYAFLIKRNGKMLKTYRLEMYTVTLPEDQCMNCGIRLIRQAKEWGRYRFWSCADVDIVKGILCLCNGKL